jgi:hypothetical protein
VRWELPDDAPAPVPFVNGWVLVAVPRIGAASAMVNCVETPSTPLLAQLATDLCYGLLPEHGPAAGPPRPARRARLTVAGAAGAAAPRPPADRGRLVYREQVQFSIGADGAVANCRPGAVVNLWGEDRFDLCRFVDTNDGPFFAPGTPAETGRMILEVYE